MVRLGSLLRTTNIILPSTADKPEDEQIKFEMLMQMPMETALEVAKITDVSERNFLATARLLVDWNITDDDGQKLPPTDANFRKLPSAIITELTMHMVNEVIKSKPLTEEQKKTLSSTLMPDPTAASQT